MATQPKTQAVSASPVIAVGGGIILLMATLSHAANDTWAAILSPLLPQIRDQYNVTIGQTGILVAILSFAGSMLQPFMGVLGDHVDRRWLAAFGPVLTGVGLTLIGYAPNFYLLGALILLGGLGSAIFHPAGAAYVAMSADPNRRGLFVSLFSAGGTIGMGLGPLVAKFLGLNALPWALPVGIVLGVITFMLLPSAAQTGNNQRRLSDYVNVFRGPIRWLWTMSVLRSLSSVSYMSLLGFILRERGLESHLSASLAVYNIASAFGGIIGGRISDRVGRTVVLRSSILITIPMFIALVLSSPANWWYYPLTALVGMLVMANIPVTIVTAQEYAPHNIATASALMMGFAWGTSGVVYPLIGSLADLTSPITAMIVAIVLLIPAFLITIRLPEPQRTTEIH